MNLNKAIEVVQENGFDVVKREGRKVNTTLLRSIAPKAHEHTIWRLATVMEQTGMSRTHIYEAMKAGLFPQNFKIGPRAAGWVSAEVIAVMTARMKGLSNTQIRQLILEMTKARAL